MAETSYISMEDEETMWTRNFEFNGVQLKVEEEWGIGIGGTVWEGGVLLASFISSQGFPAESVRGGRCLELGAGVTGLPSIVAFYRGLFKEVVVTDIHECIAALEENVAVNLPAGTTLRKSGELRLQAHVPSSAPPSAASPTSGWDLPASVVDTVASAMTDSLHVRDSPGAPSTANVEAAAAGPPLPPFPKEEGGGVAASEHPQAPVPHAISVPQMPAEPTVMRVEELDWRSDVAFLHPPYDVLLVADVVYIAELMLPLVKCMASLVTESSLIYLAYYERSAAAAKEFWEILPQYFTFEKVLEERYGASFHPSDVGVFQLRLKGKHAQEEGTLETEAGSAEEEAPPHEEGTPETVAGSAEEEASSQAQAHAADAPAKQPLEEGALENLVGSAEEQASSQAQVPPGVAPVNQPVGERTPENVTG